MNLSSPIWLMYLCDADLRVLAEGFRQEAERMTVEECQKLHEVFEERKAALLGGHSFNA